MALNITILGLGAVGASLGLALGTLDPKALDTGRPVITGWDPDKRAMSDARGRLAVDRTEAKLTAAVKDADVVFVTVPFGELRALFTEMVPALKNGAVVTDTTDSKAAVLQWASELLPTTVDFIGGHPLASIGGQSLRDASAEALRNTIYCLAPLPRTRPAALDGIEALVTAIGAKPYYIDAVEHDSYAAAAAHLPLAAAVAVMETVSSGGGWREIQPVAGEALLRTTELAGGDPEDAAEALLSNADATAAWIDRLIEVLVTMRGQLHDPDALRALLERTLAAREGWLRSQPNVRPGEDSLNSGVTEVDRSGLSGLFFGRRPARDRDRRR